MKRKIIILILPLFFFLLASSVFALKSTDVDGNGIVNSQDIRLILENWLVKVSSIFDIDENLKVNSLDLSYVIKDFGKVFSTPTPYPTSPPPPAGGSEWTQFAHDPQRTAYNPQNLGSSWSLKWIWNGEQNESTHIYYGFDVQPVTGDGKVYIGTMNYGPSNKQNQLIAINDGNGTEAWNYPVDSPILHTAAFDNGYVYFASQNGTVYKVSSSGQLVKSRTLTGQIYAAPLIANGALYIGTTSNFYALNLNDLSDKWNPRNLGAEIRATAGYSQTNNLVIVEAQNMHVYALNTGNGNTVWDFYAGGQDRVSFEHLYPAISDLSGSVIVRTDVDQENHTENNYACNLLSDANPKSTIGDIRSQIGGTKFETFFVLNLTTGIKKFVAPVHYAAEEQNFGESCYGRVPPPPPVIRKVSASEEVAYLVWRSGEVGSDPRDDSAFGEMDLTTGNIRYVQVNENNNRDNGVIRMPTDEVSFMSMAGDVLFHMGWQAAGAERITSRAANYGSSYNDALPVTELYAALRSLRSGSNCSNHTCDGEMGAPYDSCSDTGGCCYNHPGFYVYTSPCTQAMSPPESMGYERNTHVVISNGTVYSKGRDGAIMAFSTQ